MTPLFVVVLVVCLILSFVFVRVLYRVWPDARTALAPFALPGFKGKPTLFSRVGVLAFMAAIYFAISLTFQDYRTPSHAREIALVSFAIAVLFIGIDWLIRRRR